MSLFLRHIADYLNPLSRATFRTVSPVLAECVAPSPHVVGVACHELHKYLLRWKDEITHLSILFQDDACMELLWSLPALRRLVHLDMRFAIDEGALNVWFLECMPGLESLTIVAHAVTLPRCRYPRLREMMLVATTHIHAAFEEDWFPMLETLHLEASLLSLPLGQLPQSLLTVRIVCVTVPISLLEALCVLQRIRHLALEGCRLTFLPEALGGLTTLETLSVAHNSMSVYNDFGERDGCMLRIHGLHNLRHLDVSGNICVELGPQSIQFPDGLQSLDVRSYSEAYYNDPFFDLASLDQLETLYTTKLPTREDFRQSLQNVKEVVYAPPRPRRMALHRIQELCRLWNEALPSVWRNDMFDDAVDIPCSIDGVHLRLRGPLHERDVPTYHDL